MHAQVHLASAGEVTSFWAGCGAVRRDAFFQAGSFDEAFRYPSVEDVEFGGRLHLAGYGSAESRDTSNHRKRWTLTSATVHRSFRRSIPWTMLALGGAERFPANSNFTWSSESPYFSLLSRRSAVFWQ